MAGHSKWANIKHKKARTDQKRGKEFTKIAKEITIAARAGGGDVESNAKLKLVMQKAKAINMPNDNINRAIKKGTGELESEIYEEIIYEGYAPGGVAIMLDIASDNRNRTAPEVRHIFSKNNGNLGETGCVSWMFKRAGLIVISRENIKEDMDDFILKVLDMEAEDIKEEENVVEIICPPEQFIEIIEALEKDGIIIDTSDITMIPTNTIDINDAKTAEKVIKLIDILEDHDDVQNVYANFVIPDDILESLFE